ncbi:hypothetical protein HPB47_005408 [Ixodes persulcatus]|uniref:Uncharacterized protein n=1 Tax=Ixodes persulcatus TaxID=34615 RepID=A0AC60PD15_IXOPE|nr:hypothetical protein HPB47_005408 [Ixodes persulcatus]
MVTARKADELYVAEERCGAAIPVLTTAEVHTELDANRGYNWPLRGAKFTLWEGRVRVPAFVWSPKFLKRSRVSNQLMHISDWLPTLYTAAGRQCNLPVAVSSSLINPEAPSYVAVEGDLEAASPAEAVLVAFCL